MSVPGRMGEVLSGRPSTPPPLWMMRQAGRYLPEYRAVRDQAGSFLGLCYDPAKAAEVTLQPIRRFGFDAAIIFSDILVLPHALGAEVSFHEGEGPRIAPVTEPAAVEALERPADPARTGPVYEAIALARAALPRETALYGFAGAPWTVATYMVGGKGGEERLPAKLFARREPKLFQRLVDILVAATVEHLARQAEAGADLLMLFDSWAGELAPEAFERWCIRPAAAIAAGLRARGVAAPFVGFPRGAGTKLAAYAAAVPCAAIGIDTAEDRAAAAAAVPAAVALQGNLDPLALIAGGAALDAEVDAIRAAASKRPWIVNLGHGIRPETPIENVERFVARVRG